MPRPATARVLPKRLAHVRIVGPRAAGSTLDAMPAPHAGLRKQTGTRVPRCALLRGYGPGAQPRPAARVAASGRDSDCEGNVRINSIWDAASVDASLRGRAVADYGFPQPRRTARKRTCSANEGLRANVPIMGRYPTVRRRGMNEFRDGGYGAEDGPQSDNATLSDVRRTTGRPPTWTTSPTSQVAKSVGPRRAGAADGPTWPRTAPSFAQPPRSGRQRSEAARPLRSAPGAAQQHLDLIADAAHQRGRLRGPRVRRLDAYEVCLCF